MPAPAPPVVARRSRPRRWVVAALSLVLVALLCACQVQVEVDTIVDRSGAGTVTVAVGLDQAAADRIGALETEVKVEDLRQAGWTVTGPAAEPDGLTWIRASKPFADNDQMQAVLAEVAGADVLFRDMTFSRMETDDDITYQVTGEVDLSQGVATFADPEVAAQLGDPFGGNLAAIEAEEGRPISDMVTFEVSTIVAGSNPQVVRPALTDVAPQAIDVSTVEVKPPPMLVRFAIGAAVVVGVIVVVLALLGVRRRMHAG